MASPISALVAGSPSFIDVGVFAATGNTNWDAVITGPYLYASFSTSVLGAAAQFSARWWDIDFGAAGIWDMNMIHTLGFDVGIYSFQIDGVEFGRADGWTGGADIANVLTVISGVRIPAGRHRFRIVMIDANGAATGLKYYPAVSGIQFRRTASTADGTSMPAAVFGAPRGRGHVPTYGKPAPFYRGRLLNIMPIFATGNTNWDNLARSDTSYNGYEMYSTSAVNAARWWDVTLAAGQWDLDLSYATFSSAGIISVQLDGVTQGTIDTYTSSTIFRNRSIVRITVPTPGVHRLNFLMATKNASSSAYYGDISNLALRQVSGGTSVAPGILNFTLFWSAGSTTWNTIVATETYHYTGSVQSSGAQNAALWWYVNLSAGTWDFELLHDTGGNRGIYSIQIDDVQVGTIDGYGSTVVNVRTAVTAIAVAATGRHKLSLVMATKNGSSSAYYGTATALQMRRTA